MIKKLLILSCGLVLLSAAMVAADFDQDRTAQPIEEVQSLSPPMPSAMAPCTMVKHDGAPSWYWGAGYSAGVGTVTLFDPAVQCGTPTYPFEITAFSFTLYDDGSLPFPAYVDVVVFDMIPGSGPCAGLGQELCRFSVVANAIDFEYPTIGTVDFPDPCCVEGPVFIGLEYTAGTTGATPSILFDDALIVGDTCINWMYDGTGAQIEFYDFWTPPPVGEPIFYVDGETVSANCVADTCHWLPGDTFKSHFPQLPDELGWDVNATAPVVLADDFECIETGPIKDFHFWGSWKHGIEGVILYFVISLHEDIPADQSPTGYSMPGITLREWEVWDFGATPYDPPSLEGWYDPATGEVIYDDHTAYFQYDVCLPEHEWFVQDSGRIYWVNISAVIEDPDGTRWGWKSTGMHWNDDAVWALWGDLNWIEMYEPPIPNDLRFNQFWIAVLPTLTVDTAITGGTDYYDDGTSLHGWYFYPQEEWWNIWFYDHPFDPDRIKVAHIEFDVFPMDPTGPPAYFEIAVNWSTDLWSLDFPDMGPPLPGTIPPGAPEELYIGRYSLMATEVFEGHYAFDFRLPDYNPEWVSIDVRGFNFIIPEGAAFIEHDCVWQPPSLDLSFVVTGGEEPPPDSGACCYTDPPFPDMYCVVTTEEECVNVLGGVYQGDQTQCEGFQACCLPLGDCVMADALCCVNELGGVPQGTGTTCGGVMACCLPVDGSCVMVDSICCVNELGGSPQGTGTTCGGNQACCLPGGACTMADSICCVNELGGTPQGAGFACTALEACCFADGSCQDLDPLCCVDMGGVPQGPGTDCATTECPHGWQPGDPFKMHYPQLPDETGWDVAATRPMVLADDWQCTESGWVKDIHWWGSFKDDFQGEILYFLLSIHEDIPADSSPTGYSMPGATLWEREVYDFFPVPIDPLTAEGWYNPFTGEVLPDNNHSYFQYNVFLDIDDWFWQNEGTIYWLNISAVTEDPSVMQWGWKSSIDHFNDDAVWALWGDLAWVEMYEPDVVDPIVNWFFVTMDETGHVIDGGGQDAFGDGWYYYPWYDWWNIWFYDHPFDPARHKVIHIELDVFPFVGGPGYFELAVNWSTDQWSLDNPGIDRPPLPGEDEDLYIGREILFASDYYEGHLIFDWVIPTYNPEWVSIDIRGFNFVIPEAWIEHACVGSSDPQSLDLSFVITGDSTGKEPTGACCLGDGDCADLTLADCLALGDSAVFRGVGTYCLGDFAPANGYDDACECCGLYTGGITGNANCSVDGKLTLSDISRLIDRVYISKALLCCEKNGNTNASADEKITLSDISRLIDAIYISKLPPEPCLP